MTFEFLDIESLRKEKKMTQFALAKAVGVSPNTIRLWESKVTKPSDENYKKLLNALGISSSSEQ
jgi:transcriptional regulator with XRE-family HTH domain